MRTKIGAYLELLRPPNVVTAGADVLAGYAAAGRPMPWFLPTLVLSGMALYAGGVVLNDFFDRRLDERERPERPIPSGRVAAPHAATAGVVLLIVGIAAAFLVSVRSGLIAAGIAGCAVAYDAWSKHNSVLGPTMMGMCRGGNLLLGVSAAPWLVGEMSYLALLPITYIGGLTVMSRGEVAGGSRSTMLLASTLIAAVCAGILLLGRTGTFEWWWAAIPLLYLVYRVAPDMWRALRVPSAVNIRVAVRSGVLSVVVLDASIAAGFAGPWYGAAVLALLAVAAFLAHPFSVT